MTPNTVLTNTPATAACRYVDHRRYPAPASAHDGWIRERDTVAGA